MKIGFVIYGALGQMSGGYFYDRMMVDHLSRMGVRIEIISLPPGNYFYHLVDNIFIDLREAFPKDKVDVLLQDELCHPSLFHLNQRLKKKLKCPVISMVHHLRSSEAHPDWQSWFYRGVEKMYLKTVDGFIFNSKTTRTVIKNFLGEERPFVVAYPGGDHVKPAITDVGIIERSRHPGPLKILFIGNVIPRKGLHVLVAALGRLPRHAWRLTVAGSLSADIRYAGRTRRLIGDAGLSDQVDLMDSIDTVRLENLLENHHCLAVPSFYEGFGIVYLEAMAYGLPVIASRAGAVPEIIDDGIEGFLVSPGDVTALADRIGRFIHDRDLLSVMGLSARKRYREHPSWADSTVRIHDFLMKWFV